MNNVSIFKNDKFGELRVILQDGEPWFVASEIAKILGYRDGYTASRTLDQDEKDTHLVCTLGGTQEHTIISEAGLYTLMIRADKETVKPFRRWVTHDVLPSIRKNGGYIHATEEDDPLTLADKAVKALLAANKKLADQFAEAAPKAALADNYLSEGEAISIGALAKKLQQEGLDIGQNRLFEYLRSKKVLISQYGVNYNTPTQRYFTRGWFEIIQPPPAKQGRWVPQVRVTPKGVHEISRRIHELLGSAL